MRKDHPKRVARFLPNGKPRWVRIYDNGGMDAPNGSADRYTAVFTGRYPKDQGHFWYRAMSAYPFHPQGIGIGGSEYGPLDTYHEGKPYQRWAPAVGRKCHLGTRINFDDLPPDCQRCVLQDYCSLWDLPLPKLETAQVS